MSQTARQRSKQQWNMKHPEVLRAASKRYSQNHQAELSKHNREWYWMNREQARAAEKKWRKENPDKVRLNQRKAMLKRRYGLTLEQYNAMLVAQDGHCAICLCVGPLHVDHDHATGKVRALLCDGHNKGLGFFHDSPNELRAAANYLEQHKEK